MTTDISTAFWSYQVHRSGGRTTVALAGEIDLTGADAMQQLLLAQISAAGTIDVDASGVTFLDLCAISALVSARRAAVAAGCRLSVSHAGAHLRRVLHLTGAHALLAADR